MGNAIPGKKRTARVMKVDGTTCKYRPPSVAGDALQDHPGHQVLESEEVRRLGVRARPLDPDAPLKPGKLYFLVELPRVPRRTWSGALTYGGGRGAVVGAGERLESLMLARRSASDVAATVKAMAAAASSVVEEAAEDGTVRLRVRLPKAEVARLVKDSRDAADAAERIMRLCVDRDHRRHGSSAPATPVLRLPPAAAPAVLPLPAIVSSRDKKKPDAAGTKKEKKRARFVTVPDEIIGF